MGQNVNVNVRIKLIIINNMYKFFGYKNECYKLYVFNTLFEITNIYTTYIYFDATEPWLQWLQSSIRTTSRRR